MDPQGPPRLRSGRNETLRASPACTMPQRTTKKVPFGPTRTVIAACLSHPTPSAQHEHPQPQNPEPTVILDSRTDTPENSRISTPFRKNEDKSPGGPRSGRRKGHAQTHMPSVRGPPPPNPRRCCPSTGAGGAADGGRGEWGRAARVPSDAGLGSHRKLDTG